VIVGASLAGASAAFTLQDEGFDGCIVFIGKEPHPLREATPLKGVLPGEQPFEDSLVRPLDFYASNDIERQFGSLRLRVADTSGPAGQKPEEIVAGQHAYGNSVLDHGDVMQIPLHHAAYDGR
jgi:hypothetical protein